MKVLLKRPGQPGELGEINGYEEMSAFVDGCIEIVRLHDYRIVCNDEFLLNDSPFNCCIDNTIFFGNIFICGEAVVNDLGEHDLVGLTDAQIESEFIQFLLGKIPDTVH